MDEGEWKEDNGRLEGKIGKRSGESGKGRGKKLRRGQGEGKEGSKRVKEICYGKQCRWSSGLGLGQATGVFLTIIFTSIQ